MDMSSRGGHSRRRINVTTSVRGYVALLCGVCLLLVDPCSASGQFYSGMANSFGNFFSRPLFTDSSEKGVFSGAVNPASPLVFLPYVSGELRLRGMYLQLSSGRYDFPRDGVVQSFETDPGYPHGAALIEAMGRLQISRFSVRTHYNTFYAPNNSGDKQPRNWPHWRLGVDADLVSWNGLRFGGNVDVALEDYAFSFARFRVGQEAVWATAGKGGNSRPATYGLHGSYSFVGFSGLVPTLEARLRWPMTSNSTQVTEYEVSAGIQTPQTVLGTSVLKIGWRFTSLVMPGHIWRAQYVMVPSSLTRTNTTTDNASGTSTAVTTTETSRMQWISTGDKLDTGRISVEYSGLFAEYLWYY